MRDSNDIGFRGNSHAKNPSRIPNKNEIRCRTSRVANHRDHRRRLQSAYGDGHGRFGNFRDWNNGFLSPPLSLSLNAVGLDAYTQYTAA